VLLVAPRWRAIRPLLTPRILWALAWLALAGNLFYYVLLVSAVQMGGIAMTSLVVGFLPVAVSIIGSRGHGAVSLRKLAPSLALGLAGIACVAWQSLAGSTGGDMKQSVIGFFCALAALVSWTTYAVGNSRWLARRPDLSSHNWSLLTGVTTGGLALLLVPMAFIGHTSGHTAAQWSGFWAISAGVAVVASILGNAFWNRASRLLPLTLTGQMIVFETLFALAYAFAWQQRWPSLLEALAIVFLVAGVMLCAHAHRSPRAIAEHAG
jgi:drug/metabolite transporter (DMT)-like permease